MNKSKHTKDKLSDNELVEKILETNNALLFEVLYDRYSKLIYNKCYGFVRNEDEAKDLTQDIFLKLFVKLSTFKKRSKFSSWLYAFTYNRCVNYITRNTSKKLEKQYSDLDVGDVENLPDLSDTFDDEVDFLEMKVEKLNKVLECISPSDRMILLLKYKDMLSIKEIETVLDLKESAVKMRLKRAKDRLLDKYKTIDG